ncbi:TonB-dependent receptor [Sphingobium boeckii]|uniref:Iron complex outermembrane receptor protein n=1 Tax=Sphingobium boeckii TaxID=1082345 RepID=A0A7W9AHA6_9SPHN|nr:TonB-dependent receptor [Sphingobium boeckii]MBB5685449.1 iron complex outermembrane receptor protein [Sphingobium boeckii]
MTYGMSGILLGSVAALALASGPAAAQADGASTDAEDNGEIVITARRVNESVSSVPASITAFSADMIDKASINRAEDFVKLTPGVTMVTGTAEAGDTQINIRGINGARDAESSVALVVDGILKTNTAALNQDQGTIRQIEVLKGPQGAIYGRNAAAGAIVVQTAKPGDVLEGGMKASYANVDTIAASGFISGPIAPGIGFVLSGDYRTTDGFFRNSFLDSKTVDDQEVWNIDGRIMAELGTGTGIDIKGRYGELSGASINFNSAFQLPSFGLVNPAFNEDVNAHPFGYYSNIRPTNSQKTIEGSIKLDQDLGAAALTAYVLYSNIKNNLTADGTSADFARYISTVDPRGQATVNACFASTAALTGYPVNPPAGIGQIPVPFLFAPANGSTFGAYSPTTCDGTQFQQRNQEDISAEVRLVSQGEGPFSWQFGGYYLHINRTVGVSLGGDTGNGVIKQLYNGPDSTNPTSQLFADRFRTNVYAAFGSAQWKPTSAFEAGLALRYDIEAREAHSLVPVATDPFTGGPINPGQAFGPISDKKRTFKQLQPKVTMRLEVAPRTNLFANWGVGFKSGGFNNQGSAAIVDANFNNPVIPAIDADVAISDQFRKERSSAFEAGIKGRAGPITYNLAGYYTRVTDMQFFEFFVGSFGLLRVVSNIDRVDLKGAELNVDAKIIDGWSIYGAFNYTDSEIKKNSSRTYTVGNESPYTAKYTINLGTQIDAPIRDGLNVLFRADYRITGPTWFHTVQDQDRPTLFSGLIPISALNTLPASFGDANYSRAKRAAFGVLDLRFGLEGERWKASVFANNFLNRKYLNEVIPAIEFGGSFISPGQRQLYGVEIGYKF